MKKLNEDDCPLVKGGQGRSNKEIEDTVQMVAWLCVFGVLAIGLIVVLERILG
jgi:hypothetical protein